MRRPLESLTVMVVATAMTAACGGDDDSAGADGSTEGGNGSAASSAACDAFIAVDQAFGIDEDPEAGLAALRDFVAAAPEDVAGDVEPLIGAMETDLEAALEGEEVVVAEDAIDAYALEQCGDTRIDVEAFNYAFAGMPTEVDAGRVVFNLENRTQTGEFHEALLLRKNDDVEASAHDALAAGLGDTITLESTIAALESSFTLAGIGWLEPEGGRTHDVFAADLTPGEYVVVCLLPVDSAEHLEPYAGGDELDVPRHFDQGMFAQLTVG